MLFTYCLGWLDRIAGTQGDEATAEIVRRRSVVFWALSLSITGLVVAALLLLDTGAYRSSIAALSAGIVGLLASVIMLRRRKDAREAGLLLSVSITMGLALGPVIELGMASPQLPLLAATPVLFGFLVSTRSAVRHTLGMMLYFPALVIVHPEPVAGFSGSNHLLLSCANYMVALAACGATTVIFCRATYYVIDRLRQLSDQNAQLAADANAARQQFADFAHLASDWLWETDVAHQIAYSAGRFPADADPDSGKILGVSLLEVLRMREEDLDALRAGMDKRQPYERVMARFELPSRDTLILQLSATPRFDETGEFLGYRGVGHDITSRLRAEEQIRHFANHDALTGLQNRRAFTALMADIAVDPDARALLLLLDLDGFKAINDTHGHDCGDRLLQQVAQRLSSCLRRDDRAFRLGGDEFAVVIQGVGATHETAERLGAAVIAQFAAPMTIDEGVQVAVGGSLGAARLGTLSRNTDDLFKHADLALYAAKADGGLRYRIYTEEFAAKNERSRDLEAALRKAIDEERLEVQFQPQHRLADGAVVGFEALARWTDPVFGKVSPGDFIPMAERSGMIRSLDRLIMQKAIRAARDWPVCPVTGVVPRLCVNVSAVQVLDENFAITVDGMMKLAGFDPSRLEIELTESVLVQDNDLAARVMDQLRALGAVLAIDDFGTGYSSLGYLSRFPLDRLKIDRAFVMRIDQPSNLTITRSIAQLAFSLGLEVVAEGIESEEQMTTLRRLGVHIGQGFLFSRAIHERRVASYIRTNKVRPAPLPEPARLSA